MKTKILVLCLLFALLLTNSSALSAAPDFLIISGPSLIYKGQIVILRGNNDPELPALGAHIGSGNAVNANVTVDDYVQEAALGGNHIRLGLSYVWYAANKVSFFTLLDQNIAWAKANHLWIIPVQFTTPGDCYEGYGNRCGLWSSQSEQDSLQAFWVDVATRYANEPTIAGYDLLNEPNPPSASAWYTYADKMCNAVESVDTNHFSVIEAISDPHFDRVFTCPRVLYSVHIYTPGSFTTSGNGTYPGNFTEWDGVSNAWNAASILGATAQPTNSLVNLKERFSVNWSRSHNVPLYVGEYGAKASANGSLKYVTDVTAALNAWGVSYSEYALRHNLNSWGLLPMTGPLSYSVANQPLYDTLKSAFAGTVKPDGQSVATPTYTPTGTSTPTATPSITPTATSTPTDAPSSIPPTPTVSPSNLPTVTPAVTDTPTACQAKIVVKIGFFQFGVK